MNNKFFTNPVGVGIIGDPFILKTSSGKYYCYGTNAEDGYKAFSSDDLVNWTDEGYVFKKHNQGWESTYFWAPEVVEYNNKFYMFYTVRWKKNESLRLGVAVSDSPKGPFINPTNKPLFDFGHAAIDANVLFDDDGKKYLYYSKDSSENVIEGRHESHIYGIELSDDLLSVKGDPVPLTKPEQEWEKVSGPVWFWNEGATVFKREGVYYLMYSANCGMNYSVGYATSASPLGKFVKYANNPILSKVEDTINDECGESINKTKISGPGHNSITVSPDSTELLIAYHIFIECVTDPVNGEGKRVCFIDRMGFSEDGSIYVNGPTSVPQPYPSGS